LSSARQKKTSFSSQKDTNNKSSRKSSQPKITRQEQHPQEKIKKNEEKGKNFPRRAARK